MSCVHTSWRQALWNYFDVFLAVTGATDIVTRVSWQRRLPNDAYPFSGSLFAFRSFVDSYVEIFSILYSMKYLQLILIYKYLHIIAYSCYAVTSYFSSRFQCRSDLWSRGGGARHAGDLWSAVCAALVSIGAPGSHHQGAWRRPNLKQSWPTVEY